MQMLLSMKELNLSEKIKDLDALGVASLKIEGRMKSPSYVGFITDYYRKIINNQKYDIDSLNNQRHQVQTPVIKTPSHHLRS